jgi:hypothetical protein
MLQAALAALEPVLDVYFNPVITVGTIREK